MLFFKLARKLPIGSTKRAFIVKIDNNRLKNIVRNAKYYIPLALPRIPIDLEFMKKLEINETDHELIKDQKKKLFDFFHPKFGTHIFDASPHLYTGILFKGIVIPNLPLFFMAADGGIMIFPLTLMFSVLYLMIMSLVLIEEQTALEKYHNTCK